MNKFSYKGTYKTKNYFEGWYLRFVDNDNSCSYVFIFGISLYQEDPHAFIQIISSKETDPYYFRFDKCDFYYNNRAIRIKDNILGINELKLKAGPFDINLNINPTVELKAFGLTKSAMGCIRFLPLPTYHEIIFMDSKIEGTIKINNESKEVHGNGYMEKNWGVCFPSKWLWLQTNHFDNYNAALTLAVADITCNIRGFFCILNVDGDEFRFATYNCFKIDLQSNNDATRITINNKNVSLIIEAKKDKEQTIIGPDKKGEMIKEINESLSSTLKLFLYKDGELIFKDTANNVGYENLYFEN